MVGWDVGMGLWTSINAKEFRRTLSSRDCEMIGVVYLRLSRLSNLSPFPFSLFVVLSFPLVIRFSRSYRRSYRFSVLCHYRRRFVSIMFARRAIC